MIAVKCSRCPREINGTSEYWARLVEQDCPPLCPTCAKKIDRPMYRGHRRSKPLPLGRGQVLLSVMLRLPKECRPEEIAVAAWQEYPARFGMAGYEDKYPDSKVVSSELVKLRKLKKVEVRSPGSGRYSLTPQGQRMAREIRRLATVA